MNDVRTKHKQIGKVGKIGQTFNDSDYGSSSSFSLNFSLGSEANAASTPKKEDDSLLTKSVKSLSSENIVRGFGWDLNSLKRKTNSSFKSVNIDYRKTSVANTTALDGRLILLICFAVIIIGYKMVIVAIPYADKESLFEATTFAQQKFRDALDWANENKVNTVLSPLLCGLVIAIFSYMMVYMNSNIPGVEPPSPFSSNSKKSTFSRYGQQRSSALSLSYMSAIASGVIVCALMYYEF